MRAQILTVVLACLYACQNDRHGHEQRPGAVRAEPQLRRHFIAADEVVWDYAPTGINQITGKPFDEVAKVFVQSGPNRFGRRYRKAMYREYTDATFSTLKPREPRWEHLGMLGPLVRATVGDTIEIVFRNHTRYPVSVHPHGVFYDKANEGTPYNDGTSGAAKLDDAVPSGGSYVYRWGVPETAGPAPHDGSSVMWMYHSHTDEVRDTNEGLMGPMIVTARGRARPDGTPDDVDRELVAAFVVINENESRYTVNADPADAGFEESNLKHVINGYIYGNLPGLTMKRGERVRWYLMGMGSEVDLHTPHWHANTVIVMGMRTDVAWLLPATMAVADMVPAATGTWLFHCHVNDHIDAGMLALYTVTD